MNDVPNEPTSAPNAPKNMKCERMRESSAIITRMYSARSGTSMFPSFSTAMQ
jgi:hypothetical protein